MKNVLLMVVVAGALSACASTGNRVPEYDCPLTDAKSPKCASMEDTYQATRTMVRGTHYKVQSVFDTRVQPEGATAATPKAQQRPVVGSLSNYPEPGQQGMPVYKQPSVMRAWVAPYVDADGNLRSGEYTYFATPGEWNYGTLKRQGAAAGAFEPAKPNAYGFNPVVKQNGAPAGAVPSAPPEARAAAQAAQQAAPSAGQVAPAKPAGAAGQAPVDSAGITQPYQRLSN